MCGLLPGAQKNDYRDSSNWLCRPGRNDACSAVLTATVIEPDGTRTRRTYQDNPNAPVDCFYVYPTVSLEKAGNSDMTAGEEEIRAAKNQFARFGAACRLYAPIYRQVTRAGLRAEITGSPGAGDNALAYSDVLDAWKSYLARDNHGRGVVLIGHSQGARILTHLIAAEIDGKHEQANLVAAILPGTNIQVPKGRTVGGTFRHIPLCESEKQSGCVVAYSSYLAMEPPGPHAVFGGSEGDSTDACVNPGALTDEGALKAELPAVGEMQRLLGTTFVENPGMFSAKCAIAEGHSYLAISIAQNAMASSRVTNDFKMIQASLPGWGLHVLDVNLALGNLVGLAQAQAKEWLASKRPHESGQ